MAKVGLKNLYYAEQLTDTLTGTTYDVPVKVSGAITADVKPGSSSDTLYADNGPAETATTLGDIAVSFELKDLPLEVHAKLLGHTISGGVMISKASDVAPYVAIMFEGLKSNGKKRYVKLLKGMFQEPDDNYKTKTNKVDFQTAKIEGKFIMRTYDEQWKRTADEESADYVATIGTAWYTAVEPTA